MTNPITSDFQLDELCKEYAQDIFGNAKSYDSANWLKYAKDNSHDLCHEWADGCFYVIYHYHALQICANCNTDQGEQFVEDLGTAYTSVNELATAVAYGEIYQRTLFHLGREIEFLEDLFEAAEV